MSGAGKTKHKAERGVTLIELMIAMLVLAVGLAGVLALILTAINGNGRNKLDTSATMLAQMVLDKIVAQPANAGTPFNIQDCKPGGPTWQINTAGVTDPGSGAATLAGTGAIDFSIPYSGVPDGYKMKYVTCGIKGQQITYEVRWNIRRLDAFSKMVTVGARAVGAETNTGTVLQRFALPVTVRSIIAS